MSNAIEMLPDDHIKKAIAISSHPLYTNPPQSYEDSFRFGWLRGLAMQIETLINGRWYEWLRILKAGKFTEEDVIPDLQFSVSPITVVDKMLEQCLRIVQHDGHGLQELIEWIGYGLGIAWFKKPPISEEAWKRLYQTFNIDLMLLYPADHLGGFVAINGQSGSLNYYPTPIHVTNLMYMIVNNTYRQSVHEPCLGAASMLLPSKSLMLSGSDLSPFMCKVASIQAFLWLPWLLYTPQPITGLHFDANENRIINYFEFDTNTRIYCGDSLIGELYAPKNIFEEDSELVDIYLGALDLNKRELFKYEEEFEKILNNWENASIKDRFRLTKAYAREIPFDQILTNPPFGKVNKWTMERIQEIEKGNKKLLEARAKRMATMNRETLLEPKIKDIENDIEIKIRVTKDNQYEMVFE